MIQLGLMSSIFERCQNIVRVKLTQPRWKNWPVQYAQVRLRRCRTSRKAMYPVHGYRLVNYSMSPNGALSTKHQRVTWIRICCGYADVRSASCLLAKYKYLLAKGSRNNAISRRNRRSFVLVTYPITGVSYFIATIKKLHLHPPIDTSTAFRTFELVSHKRDSYTQKVGLSSDICMRHSSPCCYVSFIGDIFVTGTNSSCRYSTLYQVRLQGSTFRLLFQLHFLKCSSPNGRYFGFIIPENF